jgi:predicted nucleotidyltransferase
VDEFDPLALIERLASAGVEYVLIGGVAARLHGSPSLTRDLDICHEASVKNLERLSGVLREVHARLRGVDEDVPFLLDARTLAAGQNFTFVTDEGDLDLLAVPSGVAGYRGLVERAVEMDLDGVAVKVACLDDLIRMKRAAARPKDLMEVEVLSALQDEIERGS